MGNPTLDSYPDRAPVLGGTVVYSSLQALRLGLTAAIVGRGAPAGDAWRDLGPGVHLRLEPAAVTTRFRNSSSGTLRQQIVEDWAGPISLSDALPRCTIMHIAAVAQEFSLDAVVEASRADFVGLTPQGLLRSWDSAGAVSLRPIQADEALGAQIQAAVVADHEYPYAAPLLEAVVRAGGLVAVTFGAAGCEIHSKAGVDRFPSYPVRVVDDTGAGDVFAAAFFVEIVRGSSLADAARFAAVAAALNLRGVGPGAIASRDEIADRLR